MIRANELNCFLCYKVLKEKKSKVCSDCSHKFCKKHIKVNEEDFTSTCVKCFKIKIRLEISMEMETQIFESKKELNLLKEKLKTSKKDLTQMNGTILKLEESIRFISDAHLERITPIENKISEEAQIVRSSTIIKEDLEEELAQSKNSQKLAFKKYQKSEINLTNSQEELKLISLENTKVIFEINSISSKMKEFILYSTLRESICPTCKVKIKVFFKEEIIKGNQGKDSLIASVVAIKNRKSIRKSYSSTINQNEKINAKLEEPCKCLIW
jgi:hypothetical protein